MGAAREGLALPFVLPQEVVRGGLSITMQAGAGPSDGNKREKAAAGVTNPRYANGTLRRRNRARLRAMGGPCGIGGGRLGPIHYDEPSDAAHPLSFVVDEIRPVARWRQFGYDSPRAAAEDFNNLQAAHYFCNQRKGR